jgi:hypothetical protein
MHVAVDQPRQNGLSIQRNRLVRLEVVGAYARNPAVRDHNLSGRYLSREYIHDLAAGQKKIAPFLPLGNAHAAL